MRERSRERSRESSREREETNTSWGLSPHIERGVSVGIRTLKVGICNGEKRRIGWREFEITDGSHGPGHGRSILLIHNTAVKLEVVLSHLLCHVVHQGESKEDDVGLFDRFVCVSFVFGVNSSLLIKQHGDVSVCFRSVSFPLLTHVGM